MQNVIIFGSGYLGNLLHYSLCSSAITSMVNPDIRCNTSDAVGILVSGPSSTNVTAADATMWIKVAENWINRFHGTFAHLICISSSHLYGGCVDEHVGCVESDHVKLKTPYGWYHSYVEEALGSCFKNRVTICRLSNVYGPQNLNKRRPGFVSVAVRSAMLGYPVPIYGDPNVRRDYIHEMDIVRAMQFVISKRLHGTYNISSGYSLSHLELIGNLENLFGKKLDISLFDKRQSDIESSVVDNTKFRVHFGWVPELCVYAGLETYIHPQPYTRRSKPPR